MIYKTSFIDSFSLMLPANSVSYPDSFNEKLLYVNSVSGEIEKEVNKNQEVFLRGSSVFVKKFELFGNTYLRFFISRKMLPAKFYLNRSNNDNFDLLSFGVEFYKAAGYNLPDVEFILKNGFINDIDFTIDFLEDSEMFDFRMSAYKKRNPAGRVFFSTPRKYTEYKKRIGIQWGMREKSNITAPFVKFYSKHLELLDRSTDFFHFLVMEGVGVDPKLRRIEGTVTNKKHLESVFKSVLKLEYSGNRDIMMLTEKQIRDICFALLDRHLSDAKIYDREETHKMPVTPTDFVLGMMASKLIVSGYSLNQIVNFLPVENYSPTAKTRLKNRIKKGFEYYNYLHSIDSLRVTQSDAFTV